MKALHKSETMSHIAGFDEWLKNWVIANRSFVEEAGIPAGDYFHQSIEDEESAVGFWENGERVTFTDDMGYAKERVDYWYDELT